VYANGGTYGNINNREDGTSWTTNKQAFNKAFRSSGTFILKRECYTCGYATHKEIYYKQKTNPESFDAYDRLLVTWSGTRKDNGLPGNHELYTSKLEHNIIGKDFDIFSTLDDALNDRNPWKFCNYNDPWIGFPRDCGPTGYVPHTWSSLTRGGNKVRYSVLTLTTQGQDTLSQSLSVAARVTQTSSTFPEINSKDYNLLKVACRGIIRNLDGLKGLFNRMGGFDGTLASCKSGTALTPSVVPPAPRLEFEEQDATAISDRKCTECRECNFDAEFVSRECTYDSDRECTQCYECKRNEYETRPCSATLDRQCNACTSCAEDFEEDTPCTDTDDRKCKRIDDCVDNACDLSHGKCIDGINSYTCECSGGWTGEFCDCLDGETFSPTASAAALLSPCFPYKTCDNATQYETSAATRYSDRKCGPIRGPCSASEEYEGAAATFNSNRICLRLKVCGTNQYASTPPTPTSDRACTDATDCATVDDYTPGDVRWAPDAVCGGIDSGCKLMDEGDGDCDVDSDCRTGLYCGKNNCAQYRASIGWPYDSDYGWDTTDDCCVGPAAYQHAPKTATTDTVCKKVDGCPERSYSVPGMPPTALRNRTCEAWRECDFSPITVTESGLEKVTVGIGPRNSHSWCEERIDGSQYLGSSDFEMFEDSGRLQTVGFASKLSTCHRERRSKKRTSRLPLTTTGMPRIG
jgi:hypothetical protein